MSLREPVAFDGKEHFNRALHRFATAGCPILGPDGEYLRDHRHDLGCAATAPG